MRKLLVGMISVALCVVLVSSIAFATTYFQNWSGVLFYGEDYLDVLSSTRAKAYAKQINDLHELGQHLEIITLYKGASYLDYKRWPEVGLSQPEWIWTYLWDCTTDKTGSWLANLWHYVEIDYEMDSKDVYITEGSKLMSSPSSELTAIHPSVLGRLGLDSTWSYAVDLRPSDATNNISKSDRCALDFLYHTRLQPSELSVGDYFPFLLLHKSGRLAKAVFPKGTGEIRVYNIRLSSEGWIIEGIETIK